MTEKPQTWIVTAELRTTDPSTAASLRSTLNAALDKHPGQEITSVRVEIVLDEPGDGSYTRDLARAVVDEMDARREQKRREAGQKAVDLLAALGKLGRAMEDPAPAEVMLDDLVDPAVRGCAPDCPCRGGEEPGEHWDGEHDPAAEDAARETYGAPVSPDGTLL